MKIRYQNIASFFVSMALILAMGVSTSYAYAEVSSLVSDTVVAEPSTRGHLASIAARNKRVSKSLIEESDKAITNVKVFYNPVAEQIAVSFKLGKSSVTSIKVMDALGNEVSTLLNDDLESGIQSLTFDTNSELPAGFYFVRVSVGSDSVIKRISIR